jgi:DNA polymerase-3 subunit delta'
MLDKVIGNNHIKEVFQKMLKRGRIPRSLLFVGEAGIGKKQLALQIAKSFVCQNPNNFQACDVCGACVRASTFQPFPAQDSDKKDDYKRVFWSSHADVGMVVPYKRNILVDAIRNLSDAANYNPYEATARIFIIDEADKLNDEASNALLKTLEEPAENSYLFLITSRPISLLQTIRSRCQIIRFAPVETKEIEIYLTQTKKFSPKDAELSARLANGSLGKALEIDLGKYREQREAMLKVLEGLTLKKSRAILLKSSEEMNDAKFKDEYETRLEILENLIHDVWSLAYGKREIINQDIYPQLERISHHTDKIKLAAWLTEIETLRERFAVNLNKKIATDALFLKMAT